MATTKLTKRDKFAILYALVADSGDPDKVMLGEFITHEMELLDKKSSTKTVDVKKVAEQRLMMDAIASVLAGSPEPMRATPIATALDVNVQKVTAILKKMVASGEVIRTEDKKVVTFSL